MNAAQRREFRDHLLRLGLSDFHVSAITRNAVTHDRLAEAECNGDYPCDNGERPLISCTRCESGYAPSHVIRGLCDSCRCEDRIKALCAQAGVNVEFQGDPRGWTVKVSR